VAAHLSDNPAALVQLRAVVETQRRRRGPRHHFGESREYWAWRRSKQEPTLLRSLEIADAKINLN
jgi:hypothetical protein